MRPLALFGLALSLLLAALAVFNTGESVSARRDAQDVRLQASIGSEISRLQSSEAQMMTAAAQMRVNPAVLALLEDPSAPPSGRAAHGLAAAARLRDGTAAARALSAFEQAAIVPVSAACIQDDSGRQVACGRRAKPGLFGAALGDQFADIAGESTRGAATGTFLSPVSGMPTIAFVVPLRLHGRLLGLVHFDISSATASGSSMIVSHMPGVQVQFGAYEDGRLILATRSVPLAGATPAARSARPGGGVGRWLTLEDDHRSMVAALPLTVGGVRRELAVSATDRSPDPDFLNAWSPGMLAVLALALITLLGSIATLISANRRMMVELRTDPLTGLRNRRALMDDLPAVCQRAGEEEPAFLWFFDLDGFKSYNDAFGHLAGDVLLTRLGRRLQNAVRPFGGTVYRLGGDEFCVLLCTREVNPHTLFEEARAALSEHGAAFAVTASAGAVEIPREASDPTHALRLADQHMYRDKAAGRGAEAQLVTAVLHAALAQRHPELDEHSSDVAGDVELLARRVGLDEEAVEMIIRAGDLHDVGKLGIPDEIITKSGPLATRSGSSCASTRSWASASSPRRVRRSSGSGRSCAPATSGGTAAAIRTGSRARRSRSARASSRSATPFARCSANAPTSLRCRCPRPSPSCAGARAASSTRSSWRSSAS